MLAEEEAQKLLRSKSPFAYCLYDFVAVLPLFCFTSLSLESSLHDWWIPVFFFQGLDLLKRASSLTEKAQQLENEGLEKIEVAVAGSEVEGLYGLLRGAISHFPLSSGPPPPKRTGHTPTTTISHPLPQEPKGAVPEASDPPIEGVKQAPEAVSPAAPEALEVAIPPTWHPFAYSWGALRGCTSARFRVAKRGHQPHMPQSVPMCAECTWG